MIASCGARSTPPPASLRVPKVVRERVLACDDLPTLDRWLARAAVADKAAEVLGDE